MRNVGLYLNNTLVDANVSLCASFFSRLFGLMFQKKPKDFKILVFKNAPCIHSFFVFFKFDIIFLDSEYKVIAYKCNIPPFSILKPIFNSKYTIELVNSSLNIKIGDKMVIDEK